MLKTPPYMRYCGPTRQIENPRTSLPAQNTPQPSRNFSTTTYHLKNTSRRLDMLRSGQNFAKFRPDKNPLRRNNPGSASRQGQSKGPPKDPYLTPVDDRGSNNCQISKLARHVWNQYQDPECPVTFVDFCSNLIQVKRWIDLFLIPSFVRTLVTMISALLLDVPPFSLAFISNIHCLL